MRSYNTLEDDDETLNERVISDPSSPAMSMSHSSAHTAVSSASAVAFSFASAARSTFAKGGKKLFSSHSHSSSTHGSTKNSTGALTSEAAFSPGTGPNGSSTVDLMDPEVLAAKAKAAADAEAEALAAEAEMRKISIAQRTRMLEDLVACRRSDWTYLREMHTPGTNYWLNLTLVRETDLVQLIGEKQLLRRSQLFFYLGLGLGKLMELRQTQYIATEGIQLLEELEFFFASTTVQSMKMMVAQSSPLYEVPGTSESYEINENTRPILRKWHQKPVFRRLLTPTVPFQLDYREVVISLCDLLSIIYVKMIEDVSYSENAYLFQAILKFDERIKRLVIEPIRKEFSTIAAQVIQDELLHIRKLYTSKSSQVGVSSPTTTTTSSIAFGSSRSDSTSELAPAQSPVLTCDMSQSDLSMPDVSLAAGEASFSIDDEEEEV